MYHTYPESFTPVDLTGIGVRGVFHQRTGLALLRGRAVHFRGRDLTVIFCLKVKVKSKYKKNTTGYHYLIYMRCSFMIIIINNIENQ